MTAVPFVDAHLHCWDRRLFTYPWLDAEHDPLETFLPPHPETPARAPAAIFVEAAAADEHSIGEAQWAAAVAPDRIVGVVAHAPIEDLSRLEFTLDRLTDIPAVVGVRRLLQDESSAFLTDETVRAGVRAVAARGLAFDACVRYTQLPDVLLLARAAPDVVLVLDHLGKPPVAQGWGSPGARAWARDLAALAAHGSVVVKLSGLRPEADAGPLEPQIRPFIETALELFGTTRSMAGSDWPVSGRPDHGDDYASWFELLAHGYGLGAVEQRDVLESTARRVYGLQDPAVVAV